jgi:hypothetical protein
MDRDPPVIARLREVLVAQVAPPLTVSTTCHQYHFSEESAAYNDIEVREGEAFAVVVVRGALPSETFVARVWHRYADEVWLVDSVDLTVQVIPREGQIRVFAIGETVRSARLPGVVVPVATVFGELSGAAGVN